MKVVPQYWIKDNLDVEEFLKSDDPKKKFFIRECVDFDNEVLKRRYSNKFGEKF